MINSFWQWYERHIILATAIAAGLFILQLFHLYWLTTHVVALRLFGESFFTLSDWGIRIMGIVDYTEIPAILSTSLVYLHQWRKDSSKKAILYLFLLNSQWLHIFWITDEIVLESFTSQVLIPLPLWLSWVAIAIDYLEIPIIIDVVKELVKAVRERQFSRIKDIVSE